MATATVQVESVSGFITPIQARCFKLDPPKEWASIGVTSEYATVWIQPRFSHQDPEVGAYPADENGVGVDPSRSVRRGPGSFVPDADPDKDDVVAGCYYLALQLLGGYQVAS